MPHSAASSGRNMAVPCATRILPATLVLLISLQGLLAVRDDDYLRRPSQSYETEDLRPDIIEETLINEFEHKLRAEHSPQYGPDSDADARDRFEGNYYDLGTSEGDSGADSPSDSNTDTQLSKESHSNPHSGSPSKVVHRKGQLEQPFPPPVRDFQPVALAQHQDRKRMLVGPESTADVGDTIFIAVTTVCSAAAVFGLVGAGVYWYRQHRAYKSAEEAEYGPNYGTGGSAKPGARPPQPGDDKLASSAHLYHYQHTKQNIVAMDQAGVDGKGHESEDSEGEGEEADYSVYECPGLAPTGDLEVSNPLFESSPTSNSPPATGFMALKDDHSTPSDE